MQRSRVELQVSESSLSRLILRIVDHELQALGEGHYDSSEPTSRRIDVRDQVVVSKALICGIIRDYHCTRSQTRLHQLKRRQSKRRPDYRTRKRQCHQQESRCDHSLSRSRKSTTPRSPFNLPQISNAEINSRFDILASSGPVPNSLTCIVWLVLGGNHFSIHRAGRVL